MKNISQLGQEVSTYQSIHEIKFDIECSLMVDNETPCCHGTGQIHLATKINKNISRVKKYLYTKFELSMSSDS